MQSPDELDLPPLDPELLDHQRKKQVEAVDRFTLTNWFPITANQLKSVKVDLICWNMVWYGLLVYIGHILLYVLVNTFWPFKERRILIYFSIFRGGPMGPLGRPPRGPRPSTDNWFLKECLKQISIYLSGQWINLGQVRASSWKEISELLLLTIITIIQYDAI